MKVILTTANASYIHKNLALRWLYVSRPDDVDVKIMEFTLKEDEELVISKLLKEQPDVIAFSIYIWNSELISSWAQKIKAANPDILLVCGGPEATYLDQQWIEKGMDLVFRGEGEQIFWPVVIQGIDHPSVTTSKYRAKKIAQSDIAYLEQLPSPYFLEMDLLDFKKQYLYLESTRGCPFNCSYCLSSLEEGIRLFSDAYMTSTMMQLNQHRPKQIKFLDRTFNLFPKRALAIAKQLNDLRWDASIQFECEVTSMDDSLVDYFAHTAKKDRFRFEVGVQSFQPKTLEAVFRHQNNEQVKKILSLWSTSGLVVHADLIAGLPYETLPLFLDSYHQLLSCHPEEIQVGILKILPGTAMAMASKRWGIESNFKAPYTIEKTQWLSHDDVNDVQALAFATDKLYNIPRCKSLILYAHHHGIAVAELLVQLGHTLKNKDQLQVKDMVLQTYQLFKEFMDEELVIAALLLDVGNLSKVRPSHWFETNIAPAMLEKIYAEVHIRSQIPLNLLHRKAWVAIALCEEQVGYQARIFLPNQRISYFFNKEGECIHETTTRYRDK